ncbi:MAG: ornithine carbamoyltransferase [Clostridiales bacterium]|nr:ornithine carbamoyltransferase [Clostridiales bacterium]
MEKSNYLGRSFLTLKDYSPAEIIELVNLAETLRKKKKTGMPVKGCEGKNIALIFEKTSTRTRCSFEIAAADLGMHTVYLDPSASQMGKKESLKDTARVLGRMFDGIEYRGYGQKIVEDLAKYAGVPVWNGLTNEYHPTQMLADLLTIRDNFHYIKGVNLTYFGDARYNTGNSLMIMCSKMGLNFCVCAPKKYWPNEKLIEECQGYAKASGAKLRFTEDVAEGAKGADVIYTDIWVSMGEPAEIWAERIRDLYPYRVTMDTIKAASVDVIFMHCLPSFHNLNTGIGRAIYEKFGIEEMEVSDEVFESRYSRVFEEAENRMHTIKAVMYATLTGKSV